MTLTLTLALTLTLTLALTLALTLTLTPTLSRRAARGHPSIRGYRGAVRSDLGQARLRRRRRAHCAGL